MKRDKMLGISVVAVFLSLVAVTPPAASASFGINHLVVTATNRDGTVDTQAGSHPYEYTVSFSTNQDGQGSPEGTLRSVVVDLPPGVVGNPLAVPRCSRADFEGAGPRCPGNTQVGVAKVEIKGLEPATPAIYNLAPSQGVAASLGFSVDQNNSFQDASVRSGGDFGIRISDITVPTSLEIQSISETIWGVPPDESHDAKRVCREAGNPNPVEGCSSDSAPIPFLTLPTSCGDPLKTTVTVTSLENPDATAAESVESVDSGGIPAGLNSCEKVQFSPSIVIRPESTVADSPTGLHVGIHVPQSQNPEDLAAANLKDVVVDLPTGVAVNPSTADGLGACSMAQIDLKGSAPAQCPASSKIGIVRVSTPLLDHSLPGIVYIARQNENPFDSLIALYIAIDDPITGIDVKLAGKVEPDPLTGQLRAIFRENPQLPFEDLEVEFHGGPRAALSTPVTCTTFTTHTTLTPWTTPEGPDARPTDSFQISSAANGGPCPTTEAQLPHTPTFEGGTTIPIAASYSPFVFKLSRERGSQRIAAIDATLPKGLVGKLAGVSYCSEGQIAAAMARSNLGQGALERAVPSCPLASEVGTVNVGAGSGNPLYVQGHAYLGGPYKGAPLSLVIITPAVAGPFDLGVVVVRNRIYVDESTAQIHVVSDPLPRMLAGIPLDIRSVALDMNRPDFTLNPTNCSAMTVLGSATSTLGQVAPLSNRFQVGACGALGFKPNLALSLKGGTRRTKHPKLKAVVTYPRGSYANVARASVILPRSEFIDPERVANPCTRPQFSEGKCPKDSILGTAKAFTPLLDKPLTGKVYFRANGGERELPDIVADLNGQVHFVLVGHVDAVVKKGTDISRIRNTFASVPDAPVSRFVLELKGGEEGLLVNSENLCARTRRATVRLTAQNAKVHNLNPAIATSCGKRKPRRAKTSN